MATLEQSLAAQPPSAKPTLEDEAQLFVDLDLIDRNPYDSRRTAKQGPLVELADAIEAKGQLQSILVKPEGLRFIAVVGWRRVCAFRLLRERHPAGRFGKIRATVRLGLTATDLATMSYQENAKREDITPLEEARHIERMLDESLATSTEELAPLLGQPLNRVKRLRTFAKAAAFIKDATEAGVPVSPESTERTRRLDLLAALEFSKLHKHLKERRPKDADERVEKAMRRSLVENWGLRRVEQFVEDAITGRGTSSDDAEAGPTRDRATRTVSRLFQCSAKRFVVDLAKAATASAEELAELRRSLEAALAELSNAPAQH